MPLTPSQVLYLPGEDSGGTVADLDWATGLIRFHLPHEDFTRILESGPVSDRERYVLEAITHESTHLLQLSLTGFGYDFSCRLFELTLSALDEHKTLEGVFANRNDYRADLDTLFASLHRAGPDGVSALSILEGAAFLAQKASHYQQFGAPGYDRMLADEVEDAEYRLAYDLAVDCLGPDALDHFPHVANLALAVREPERVFVPLLEEFRDQASRLDIEHNHQLGLALLNSQFPTMLLGTAVDRIEAGQRHPVLEPIVNHYNRLANEGRLEPITLLARGRAYDDFTASFLVYPSVFPPTEESRGIAPIWVPEQWRLGQGDDFGTKLSAFRLLFAASLLLQNDLPDIEPRPLHPCPEAPAGEIDMPITVRSWEFSRQERTLAGAQHLGRLLSGIGEKPPRARALRGTVNITFPDDEYPGERSPLLDPKVQGFLRQVFEVAPYLLYFLSDGFGSTALLEVVAAYDPDRLVRRPDDLTGAVDATLSPEVVLVLVRLLREAADFAARQGQPRSVVLAHLRPLPEQFRTSITASVLN